MRKLFVVFIVFMIVFSGCRQHQQPQQFDLDLVTLSGLHKSDFDKVMGRDTIALYSLINSNGVEVCITNYGARVVSLMVPDKDSCFKDVVLGFDNIDSYINTDNNFGATIGRYANRINKGLFTIIGKKIQLPCNNFGHCLHGGSKGWDRKIFKTEYADSLNLLFSVVSPDGDENFPGTVKAFVKYSLREDNSLMISYSATTDAPTIINLTNHSYFNLSGDPNNTILDNIMYINSVAFTPIDSTFMTTGEIRLVEDTPMDFSIPKSIGRDIENDDEQLKNGLGYDHNWVLHTAGIAEELAASVVSPISGIKMDVYTTEPGLQFYTSNFLDGSLIGKLGIPYKKHSAVVLETQHYPDSPNKPDWPSVVLYPGEIYTSKCIYTFSVVE